MIFFLRYILPVIAVGLLVWGIYAWRQNDIQHWKTVGRDELTAELKLAQESADEQTRKKQAEINNTTRKAVHETRKAQGADAPASPYLRSVVDGLRASD